MISSQVESAFAQAIAPTLQIQRLSGSDWRVIEISDPCLIAIAENFENVVGPLWRGTLRIRLEYPPLAGAQAAQGFSQAEAAVAGWLATPSNIQGVSLASGRIAGCKVNSAEAQAPQDNRWVSEFTITLGLATA